jgi:hypothetical protein
MIIAKEAGGTKGLLLEATHNTKFYHCYNNVGLLEDF